MENSFYKWKHWLKNDKVINITSSSPVLHFTMVNQGSPDIYSEWLFFSSVKELMEFIKFIALPSVYCSSLFGEKENTIYLVAESYNSMVELLGNNNYKNDIDLRDRFISMYRTLESINAAQLDFSLIKDFCKRYNDEFDFHKTVFSTIEVYENIHMLGLTLIKEYKKQGMIKELEEVMEMTEEQIEEMFESIDNNPFMKRKMKTFLDSRNML